MIIHEDKNPYNEEAKTKWYHPIVLLLSIPMIIMALLWVAISLLADKIKRSIGK